MAVSGSGAPADGDVHRVIADGRVYVLVGTAHVSRESAELVERVIAAEQPDSICIELDPRRFEALARPAQFAALDLRAIIRQRQLAPLLVNLILSGYQRQLGGALGVMPGAEMLAAARTAERLGIPMHLCDRDVRITLRRAWAALSLWRKSELVAVLGAALFETPSLDEAELRRLRQGDVLSRLMQELGTAFPAIKTALIDERDAYLATRLRAVPGARIMAVIGAGHVAGMVAALRSERSADLAELEALPPKSRRAHLVAWSLPVLILAGLIAVGMRHGAAAVADNALFWVVATGLPGAVGAVVALAHPLTIAATFLSAPITTLSPLLGVGYVAAFVQAYVRPPRVFELQSVVDDVRRVRRWWENRLLRVCLVFLLTTLGTAAGSIVGLSEIASNLLR
ncbi:MAG: TraB/GumN family protein [Candidatus Binatia bacterium]